MKIPDAKAAVVKELENWGKSGMAADESQKQVHFASLRSDR